LPTRRARVTTSPFHTSFFSHDMTRSSRRLLPLSPSLDDGVSGLWRARDESARPDTSGRRCRSLCRGDPGADGESLKTCDSPAVTGEATAPVSGVWKDDCGVAPK
jgi:hypothetical protein